MLMFTKGRWTIWATSNKHLSLKTTVKHACHLRKSYKGHSPYPARINPKAEARCWRCHAKIPDGVLAIWTLQNWEVL